MRHDRDPVGHGQRFFLVVGDEDEGDAGLMLQPLELDLHVLSELVVEGGERLVEEQHLGARRQGARQRHPLLLAAGYLAGAAVPQRLHPHELEHRDYGRIDFRLGLAQHFEPEGDVLADRHVWEQRVILEYGVHRPLVGGQPGNIFAVKEDLASGRKVEAGDQAQESGLAAP